MVEDEWGRYDLVIFSVLASVSNNLHHYLELRHHLVFKMVQLVIKGGGPCIEVDGGLQVSLYDVIGSAVIETQQSEGSKLLVYAYPRSVVRHYLCGKLYPIAKRRPQHLHLMMPKAQLAKRWDQRIKELAWKESWLSRQDGLDGTHKSNRWRRRRLVRTDRGYCNGWGLECAEIVDLRGAVQMRRFT